MCTGITSNIFIIEKNISKQKITKITDWKKIINL